MWIYLLTMMAAVDISYLLPLSTIMDNATWQNDDWELETLANLGPVLDKRYEASETKSAKSIDLPLKEIVFFSACQVFSLEIYVNDGEKRRTTRKYIETNNLERCNNYTLLVVNHTFINVFENGRTIVFISNLDFKPEQVTVKTVNNKISNWKLFDHKVRVADYPSQEPSVMSFPPTGKNRMTLYASVGETSILNITVLIGNNVETHLITPTQNRTEINETSWHLWQGIVINIDPSKETKVILTRNVKDENGYSLFWGFDYNIWTGKRKENEYVVSIMIATVMAGLILVAVLYFILSYCRKRKKEEDGENTSYKLVENI